MAGLSYFPAPYEDECYYSILCRYMLHCGLSTRSAEGALFGRQVSPGATLLIPYLSNRIPGWVSEETGITEGKIIREHTAFYYFAAFCEEYLAKSMLRQIRTGRKSGQRMPYRRAASGQYLRYCPACAYEEKIRYGEMYWHRLHQLDGVHFCHDHGIALVESSVSWYNTKRSLIPASHALAGIYEQSLEECMRGCVPVPPDDRGKYDAIFKDIEWLTRHGDETGGFEAVIQRYRSALTRRGWLKGRHTDIENASALRDELKNYWGKEFLKGLHLMLHEYLEWDSIPLIVVKFLTPLQHILLMGYLCGSAEEFFAIVVSL